jgi:hypothetical protein
VLPRYSPVMSVLPHYSSVDMLVLPSLFFGWCVGAAPLFFGWYVGTSPVILRLICRYFPLILWLIRRVCVLGQSCCKRYADLVHRLLYRKLILCCAVFGLFCYNFFFYLIDPWGEERDKPKCKTKVRIDWNN